jgi:hypothetical protein
MLQSVLGKIQHCNEPVDPALAGLTADSTIQSLFMDGYYLNKRRVKMERTLIKSYLTALMILMLPTLALAGSATISWNANTDNDLAGYRVYYGTTRGGPYGSSTALVPKTQTSCTISDLTSGTYYFVVVALDTANNESPWSAEAIKTIAPAVASTPAPPPAPTPTAPAPTTPSSPTTPVVVVPASTPAAAPAPTAPSSIVLPAVGIYGQISGNAIQLNQVSFNFPARSKKAKLTYQAYDINSAGEVSILINGSTIAYVKKTKSTKWGGNKTITIPKAYLSSSSTNIVTFKTNSGSPTTDRWGVRNIKVK